MKILFMSIIRRLCLTLSLFCTMQTAWSDDVLISPSPLAGVTVPYGPNILFALANDYQMVGAAHGEAGFNWRNTMTQRYQGYFDANKCYEYHQQGYFYPTRLARHVAPWFGLCSGSHEFSGNFLNFISMSTADIIRSKLTGGNRAFGLGNRPEDYAAGDTTQHTFLRRANVLPHQNGLPEYQLGLRWLDFSRITHADIAFAQQLLPHIIVNDMMPSFFDTAHHSNTHSPYQQDFYDAQTHQRAHPQDRFADQALYFDNHGFRVQLLRKIQRPDQSTYYAYHRSFWSSRPLNVVVKVCDPAVGLESNCVAYGQHYKPEGLLQQYSHQDMRVGVMAYGGNGGGVLRTRLKYLSKSRYVINQDTPEWDNRGIFSLNPENANEGSSGVIQYINRFGDVSGYHNHSVGAGLYFSALRYLAHQNNPYPQPHIDAQDGFPMPSAPVDPISYNIPDGVYQCRRNNIVYLGSVQSGRQNTLNNQEISIFKQRIQDNEHAPIFEADSLNADIAALSYQAHTTPFRNDVYGDSSFINNFVISLNKSTDNPHNALYLMAKYGGFAHQNQPLPQPTLAPNPDMATQPLPHNLVLASQAEQLASGLESTMTYAAAPSQPSQSATLFSSDAQGIVQLSQTPLALRATYQAQSLSGDIIASTLSPSQHHHFQQQEAWRAARLLTQRFHGEHKYHQRHVFTIANHQAIEFTPDNAQAIFQNQPTVFPAEDLIAYMLGNNKMEQSGAWRVRNNILGSIVHADLAQIHGKPSAPNNCRYANHQQVSQRPHHFAAAANDGMLHIFNTQGEEVMAYFTPSALPKLDDFVKKYATHQYLNDGTPQVAEMCYPSNGNTFARSILLGTTGRGGAAVYALDLTDLSQPSTDNILWEFNHRDDADLGLTIGKPAFSYDADGNPIAIVSSGYNNPSKRGYLFILNINKPKNQAWQLGKNYQKIALNRSGVGSPFAFDADDDGKADDIFVGDHSGQLWQLKRQGKTWKKAYQGQALFTPKQGEAMPISGTPNAKLIHGKTHVVFATGSYLSASDTNVLQQNYAYGLIADGKIPVSGNELSERQLQQSQQINPQQKLYQLSLAEESRQGWKIKLLKGQLAHSSSVIRRNKTAEFTLLLMSEDAGNFCQRVGSTSYLVVDIRTGKSYHRPIFDTNQDGISNQDDQIGAMMEFTGIITPSANVSRFHTENHSNQLATRPSARNTCPHVSLLTLNDGVQQYTTPINGLCSAPHVKRLSWREIPMQ